MSAQPPDGIVTETWTFPRPEAFTDVEYYPRIWAIGPDGSVLTEGVRYTENTEIKGRSELALWRNGAEVARIDKGPPTENDTAALLAEDRFGSAIAWTTGGWFSMSGGDWALYVHSEGQTRLISDSSHVSPTSYIPTLDTPTYPTLTADQVYWNSLRPKPGVIPSEFNFNIEDYDVLLFSRDIRAEGDIEVVSPPDKKVVTHTGDEDGNLYYMVRDFPNPGYQIIKRYPDSREQTVYCGTFSRGEYVSALAASTNAVAFSWGILSADGRSENEILGITVITHNSVLEIQDTDGALNMSMSGDLLAWGNGSGFHDPSEYILNIKSRQVVKVGECRGYSEIAVAGHQVAWAMPSPDPRSKAVDFVFGELSDDFVKGRT